MEVCDKLPRSLSCIGRVRRAASILFSVAGQVRVGGSEVIASGDWAVCRFYVSQPWLLVFRAQPWTIASIGMRDDTGVEFQQCVGKCKNGTTNCRRLEPNRFAGFKLASLSR